MNNQGPNLDSSAKNRVGWFLGSSGLGLVSPEKKVALPPVAGNHRLLRWVMTERRGESCRATLNFEVMREKMNGQMKLSLPFLFLNECLGGRMCAKWLHVGRPRLG